jgi:hypothetical protein
VDAVIVGLAAVAVGDAQLGLGIAVDQELGYSSQMNDEGLLALRASQPSTPSSRGEHRSGPVISLK